MTFDLFSWNPNPPATARIIAFPLNRDVGRVRRVAETFLRQPSEKAQNSYWQRAVRDVARQFARTGLPAKEIDRQIEAFRSAVQTEIDRLQMRSRLEK